MKASATVAVLAAALAVGPLAWAGEVKDFRGDVGKPAPALTGAVWDGNPVSLEAVRGNVLLLAFWDPKGAG
jgi:hypothetical protein